MAFLVKCQVWTHGCLELCCVVLCCRVLSCLVLSFLVTIMGYELDWVAREPPSSSLFRVFGLLGQRKNKAKKRKCEFRKWQSEPNRRKSPKWSWLLASILYPDFPFLSYLLPKESTSLMHSCHIERTLYDQFIGIEIAARYAIGEVGRVVSRCSKHGLWPVIFLMFSDRQFCSRYMILEKIKGFSTNKIKSQPGCFCLLHAQPQLLSFLFFRFQLKRMNICLGLGLSFVSLSLFFQPNPIPPYP